MLVQSAVSNNTSKSVFSTPNLYLTGQVFTFKVFQLNSCCRLTQKEKKNNNLRMLLANNKIDTDISCS